MRHLAINLKIDYFSAPNLELGIYNPTQLGEAISEFEKGEKNFCLHLSTMNSSDITHIQYPDYRIEHTFSELKNYINNLSEISLSLFVDLNEALSLQNIQPLLEIRAVTHLQLRIPAFPISHEIAKLLSSNENLEILTFNSRGGSEIDFSFFREFLAPASLRELGVIDFDLTNTIPALVQLLAINPNIKALNLKNSTIDSDGAALLANTALEALSIDAQSISSIGILNLSTSNTIKRLIFKNGHEIKVPLEAAQNWLANKKIESLSLMGMNLEDNTINTLGLSSTLKELNLSDVENFRGNNPSPLWLEGLDILAKNSRIQSLSLRNIAYEEASQISMPILLANQRLRHLQLHITSSCPTGILPNYYFHLFNQFHSLEYLNLRNVAFENNFDQFIASSSLKKSLQKLKLEELEIDELETLITSLNLQELFIYRIKVYDQKPTNSIPIIYINENQNSESDLTEHLEALTDSDEDKSDIDVESSLNKISDIVASSKSLLKFDFYFLNEHEFEFNQLSPNNQANISQTFNNNANQRQLDMNDYVGKYVALFWWLLFSNHTSISGFPLEIKNLIFLMAKDDLITACLNSDDEHFIWKTREQRLEMLDCLIENFCKNRNSSGRSDQFEKVIIIEKPISNYENRFAYFTKKSTQEINNPIESKNLGKRPNDLEDKHESKKLCY